MFPLLPFFPISSLYPPLQTMNDAQTLLVDGYISRSFRSRAAERCFLDLLQSTSSPLHTILSYTGREGQLFFIRSVPSYLPVQHSSPPGCWLLDHGIVDRGTVVPQRMWAPQSALDRARHVVWAQLQMPIFFEGEGRLGISLVEATNGRCHGLRDANNFAPLGPKSSTYIRIIWPGYKEFKRQVPTREPSSTHNPINIASFARRIGRTVDAFLQVCELDPGCVDDRLELWRIGPGGIQGGDIVIIGAVHVSAGSWMPIIQLNRYIF